MIKKILTIVLLTVAGIQLFAAGNTDSIPGRMNIATFNIRVQTIEDLGERSWQRRKKDVAKVIKQHDFDIFGVQEVVNKVQQSNLKKLLPQYTYFGKGRDNQQGTAGEQIGIFYKTKRFEAKEKGSFFLSETPDTISKGWDAALRRMCVWTKFQDLQTSAEFYVFCSHFDHMGVKARVESARLIVKRVKQIAGDMPVFFLGDLNASPVDGEMYGVLASAFDDSKEISQNTAVGSVGTFNGFDVSKSSLPLSLRIDYIFCQHIKVFDYKVLNDRFLNRMYPSDHFPLMIECVVKKTDER